MSGLTIDMLLSQNWKMHFFFVRTLPSKTFLVFWKPSKNIVKHYENLRKNIIPKVGISVIFWRNFKAKVAKLANLRNIFVSKVGIPLILRKPSNRRLLPSPRSSPNGRFAYFRFGLTLLFTVVFGRFPRPPKFNFGLKRVLEKWFF